MSKDDNRTSAKPRMSTKSTTDSKHTKPISKDTKQSTSKKQGSSLLNIGSKQEFVKTKHGTSNTIGPNPFIKQANYVTVSEANTRPKTTQERESTPIITRPLQSSKRGEPSTVKTSQSDVKSTSRIKHGKDLNTSTKPRKSFNKSIDPDEMQELDISDIRRRLAEQGVDTVQTKAKSKPIISSQKPNVQTNAKSRTKKRDYDVEGFNMFEEPGDLGVRINAELRRKEDDDMAELRRKLLTVDLNAESLNIEYLLGPQHIDDIIDIQDDIHSSDGPDPDMRLKNKFLDMTYNTRIDKDKLYTYISGINPINRCIIHYNTLGHTHCIVEFVKAYSGKVQGLIIDGVCPTVKKLRTSKMFEDACTPHRLNHDTYIRGEFIDRIDKKKKANIPLSVKNEIWNLYCGNVIDGECYACGKTIHAIGTDWHAGHIIPEAEGGATTVENLRPLCVQCNLGMGTTNMHTWMEKYYPKRPRM